MAEQHLDAAELARQCIQAIADQDITRLRELFADDSTWELAYGLTGLSDAERSVHGGDRIARYHGGLNQVIAQVTFPTVEAFAVDDDLAFAVFTSDAVTTKGRPYGNSYVAKVSARDGRITHWLEFFDPRPAEMVRADLAESLAADHRP